MQRVKILIHCIPTLHSGRHERRDSGVTIIGFIARSETLASSAWEIDYELGCHETGDRAADLLFEIEDCLERGAQVFDALDEVAGVDVVLGACFVSVGI